MNKSLTSYSQFLKDILNFKKSGTKSGSEFNLYESPVNQYFKILFYFHNGDSDNEVGSDGGLLAPTWEKELANYYQYNSAWSYLKLNGEEERAEKLQKFVRLLSNISSESPWYFSSVSGLDTALERSAGQNKEFKIDEDRKKISIKCLPDAFDTRIGTLLDLYRDIIWSWQTKREIIPSNLRKFDMAIYIFSDPIVNIHQGQSEENSASLLDNSSNYKTSYKYIEFHNCEIDYNSSKSAYSELNNTDGFQPEYTIDIYFDDAYEQRYNEFMLRTMGDMITYDYMVMEKSKSQSDSDISKLSERSDIYNSEGFITNAMNELIGAGKSWLSNKITSIYLGNLFTISPKTALEQVKSLAAGQVFNTVNSVDDYLDVIQRKSDKVANLGNLFKANSMSKNI
jgi:hypothetical protein